MHGVVIRYVYIFPEFYFYPAEMALQLMIYIYIFSRLLRVGLWVCTMQLMNELLTGKEVMGNVNTTHRFHLKYLSIHFYSDILTSNTTRITHVHCIVLLKYIISLF